MNQKGSLSMRNGTAGQRNGRWLSLLLLSVVFCGHAALGDTILAMEYYVDVDPGAGQAVPIPPLDGAYDSPYETGQVAVDTTLLAPGPHMVYVRARSSNGVWGTYPPVLLYVYQRMPVVGAEYFIDADPGVGKGTPLEPVDGWFDYLHERIVATVPMVGLTPGNHTLYVRAMNSEGIWGRARAVRFRVQRGVTVAAAECGFGKATDTAPTFGTYTMQAEDFTFNSTVESVIKRGVPCPATAGPYRAFVRAKNDRDMWGPWAHTDLSVGNGAVEPSAPGFIHSSGTGGPKTSSQN